jgi:magnesium-transporting ATPase (P-type)
LGPSALVLCNRFHTLAMTRPLAPPAAEEPPTVALHEPHTQPAADVAHHLGVSPADGLAADEVATRLARDGHNRLPEAAPRSMWQRVLDQFRDFMILVLLGAAVLSGLIGDLADTLVILIIVVLNAAIGFWQEWRADQALSALQRMAAPHATVRRDGGQVQRVETEHLVSGDVVLLEAGNLVPADLRLQEVARLRVDESALTGESVTVEKSHGRLPAGERPLGDRHNMAYKGTLVTHGRAAGLVVATGARTQLGQVATLLGEAPTRATPLQQRLAAFGKRLSVVVLGICAVVFAIGVLRGEPVLLMALTAISLAVAAIPEALPAVVTVLLALGARRLVNVNALVRRLPSVETLGSVNVICSDKTGTLTLNRMQVREHRSWGSDDTAMWTALALCNDASPGTEGWVGDPTETALLQAAQEAGVDVAALRQASPRLHEWPFDAERKRMSTLHAALPADAPGWRAWVKGAPESVLPRCTGTTTEALATAQAWAADGMRVLAVATRAGGPTAGDNPAQSSADTFEQGLTLVGLVGLIDPPRPEARAAVAECLAAGIRPVMITGDHPATALAIARDLGIATADADGVLTGSRTGPAGRRHPGGHRARRGGVRAHGPGAEDPHRHRLAIQRPVRRDDRRRRQRRTRAAQRRHRRGHGPGRHRRGARSRQPGAAGRQLRHHRGRGARRPAHLRQHPQVHPLRAHRQLGRDLGAVPGAAAGPAHSAAADPHPVGQPGHRRPARAGPGRRAGRTRRDAAPAAPARRKRVRARPVAARAVGGPADRRAVPGGAGLGLPATAANACTGRPWSSRC